MNDTLSIALSVPAAGAEEKYANYFEALRGAGARLVPVGADADPGDFGGLLLPGGGDAAPWRYGQENMACEDVDEALDALQFAALDAFVKTGKPVLGICRGHQLVNVYFGGTLIQHLPQSAAHSRCGGDQDKVHVTKAAPDSAIFRLYGASFSVNSSHHQGVDRLGAGLRATQWSDDGIVEALEHESLPILCVQWHPERMCLRHAREDTVDGMAVLRQFAGMCKRRER